MVPHMVCCANQWPASSFWKSVDRATSIARSEMTIVSATDGELRGMILRSWLEAALPAGTA